MEFPDNLRYTQDHEWINVDGNQGQLGITDYAQTHLGDIVYVELPEVGVQIAQGETIGVIESVKAVATIYSPADGTIIKINEDLEESPELLNENPYGSWIAIIELKDKTDLDNLMTAETYAQYCLTLAEKEG